jgi:predicted Zn-dependent protease
VLLLALIGLGVYAAGWQIAGAIALHKARQELERGEFVPARDHLAFCLRVWPGDAAMHLLAARAARRAEDYEAAERHLKVCRQLQAGGEATRLEGALLLAQRGDLGPVESYLVHHVQDNHPDTVWILEALALGYFKTHQFANAHHSLNLLLERRPDQVPALIRRGRTLELLRLVDEAQADYRKAAELNPASEEARLRLGNLLVKSHRARDAAGHFEWLQERQPNDPQVLLGLARCRHEMGQRDEARRLLAGLVAQHPQHAQAVAEMGKLVLAEGQLAEAERWLRRAAELAPHERDNLYSLAQCLNRAGKKEEAQQWLARLKQLEDDWERIKVLTQEYSKAPRDPALRYEGGIILLRNGLEQEGLHWLASALQADPKHRPTHQALADYYARTGKADLAAHHRRLGAGN